MVSVCLYEDELRVLERAVNDYHNGDGGTPALGLGCLGLQGTLQRHMTDRAILAPQEERWHACRAVGW